MTFEVAGLPLVQVAFEVNTTEIASALEVELPEILRFDQELEDPKEIEARIKQILRILPTAALKQVLFMLRVFYPIR